MKTSKLKTFLSITVLLCGFMTMAQDFQGKAYYMSKTSMDMDQWGGQQLNAEQKKRMEERMKSFLEKEYILTFNKTESLYKEDEKLEAISSGRGWGGFGNSFTGGPKYKNVKTKESVQDQEFFGKQFLITDELRTLDWKMGTETKQIGQYTCFKATATKEVEKFDFRNMRPRGRNNNEEVKKDSESKKDSTTNKESVDGTSNDPLDQIEMPKTIEVVAWYTPQIPINQGPDDYWGLPGLILEVNADRTVILCTKITLNPEQKETIEKPKKGEKVTQSEYNDITTKKMEEMREMYGGRNRGGGRGMRN